MTNNPVPHEKEEQAAFFAHAALYYGRFPLLRWLLFATRSGAWLHGDVKQRSMQAAAAKKQGAKVGVADIICLIPMGTYNGLVIEMKRQKGGKVSQKQADWLAAAEEAGYYTAVCRGADEAIEVFEWYMGIMGKLSDKTWRVETLGA
jgi:hypothetical protein